MSAKKRRSPMMEGESSTSDSKRLKALELDMYLITDCVSPLFDPSRVLLRRVSMCLYPIWMLGCCS